MRSELQLRNGKHCNNTSIKVWVASFLIHKDHLLLNQGSLPSAAAAAAAAAEHGHSELLPAVGGLQGGRCCRSALLSCQPLSCLGESGDEGRHQLKLKHPRAAAGSAGLGRRLLARRPQRRAAKAAGQTVRRREAM